MVSFTAVLDGVRNKMAGAVATVTRRQAGVLSGLCVNAIAGALRKSGQPAATARIIAGAVTVIGCLVMTAGGLLAVISGGVSLFAALGGHGAFALGGLLNVVLGGACIVFGLYALDGARKAGFGYKAADMTEPAVRSAGDFIEKSNFNAEATSAENFNVVATAGMEARAEIQEPANKVKAPGAKLSTPKPPSR